MCDTFCVLPSRSSLGCTIFAKNSDRDPNEPHVVRHIPGATHNSGETVRCTYIDIPQVPLTNEIIILKPDWIWGAEMGVNLHGVAIGNEAVFTKARKEPPGLIGMDLLRLALERAGSAREAVSVITDLLAKYGQGGNCGYSKNFRYDNSFLVADSSSAYVLETAGRSWVLAPVRDAAAISNRLQIQEEYTCSSGVEPGTNFARKRSEPFYSYFAQGAKRRAAVLGLLLREPVGVEGMIRILRSHSPGLEGQEFTRGDVGSVCMHGGGLVGDHTTGSFVAVLRPDAPLTVWATGASTPCISAFKPVFFGSGAPVQPSDQEGRSYWLERERLHRAVLAGAVDAEALRAKRNELEERWLAREAQLFRENNPTTDDLVSFAAQAAKEEQDMVDSFSQEGWVEMPGKGYFAGYWRKKNRTLHLGRGKPGTI